MAKQKRFQLLFMARMAVSTLENIMAIDNLEFELPPPPEPEAYLYVNGDHRGVSLHYRSDMDISEGTTRKALITTEQADERVREALRQYRSMLEAQREQSVEASNAPIDEVESEASTPRRMRP